MDDGVKAAEVGILDASQILVDHGWRSVEELAVAVQPSVAIVAGVQPHYLVAAFHQQRGKQGSDVAVCACKKNVHWLACRFARRAVYVWSAVRLEDFELWNRHHQ